MTDFLVLKQIGETGQASDWAPVVIARGLGEEDHEAAVTQGFTGDGRYKAIEWPEAEGTEFDLGGGSPVATPVSAEAEPEGE